MTAVESTTHAPVELVLIEFPDNKFEGDIVSALGRLVDAGTIRLIDALLIRKNHDGTADWLEATDVDASGLADLIGEPAGLLAEEDVDAIADELEPGSSVGMMVFEHSWATELTEAIRGANGRLIDWARVPGAAIDELTTAISNEEA